MSDGVKIPIKADFNPQDVEREVERLTRQINKMGQAIAGLNKQKFNPVDKAAVDDMRRVQAQFESLLKINPAVRSRLKATGQEGARFGDIDWTRAYADSTQRGKVLRGVYDYTTEGTAFYGRFGNIPGQGGGRRPPGGGGPTPDQIAPDPGAYPGSGVVNAGLGAMGPVGRVAASSIGAGLRGGLLAGAGAMVGGLAAFGVAKAVGAVRDKVGDAEQEAIGMDTLKRTIGDVNVSFEMLRGTLRQAAYQVGTSFEEIGRLGEQFAKLGNVGEGGARSLAGEVGVGAGLARSLGLGLSTGVGVMGVLRQFGVTGNEDGSRRLALMIGEAVGRVGFAKADEVLAVVTSFVSTQARAGLTAPNVSGYLGSLAGLAGSGRSGLDVTGAASLLGRVNSSIMAGGGAGEAGQNFMYLNLGRSLGLSPVQTRLMLQQGAWGSGASTFGGGSLYAAFSSRFGGSAGGAAKSGVSNLDNVLGSLKSQYGGMGSDYLLSATANLLGISETQAMAMLTYGGKTMGGISDRLKGKVPLNALSSTGYAALAAIQTGGADVLGAQATSLRSRTGRDALSSEELKRLNDAMAGNDVELQRQVLTELTATREQETTEGKQTRDSIESVGREVQKFAAALIPVSNTMRDALVVMAAKLAPDSEFGRAAKEAAAYAQRGQAVGEISDKLGAFDAETETIRSSARFRGLSKGDQDNWMKMRAELRAQQAYKMRRELLGDVGQYGDSTSALTRAIEMQESGGRRFDAAGRPLSNPNSTALGEMQVLDGTAANPGFGVRPAAPGDLADRARVGRELVQRYMQIYGGDISKAAGAYKVGAGAVNRAIQAGGEEWMSQLSPEDQSYIRSVVSKQKAYSVGAGAGRGLSPGATAEEIHATLVLHPKTPDGKSAGRPVRVELGKPTAAGAAP